MLPASHAETVKKFRRVIATLIAERRRYRPHTSTARWTERAIQRGIEGVLTRGTHRTQKGADDCVGSSRKHAGTVCNRLATTRSEEKGVSGARDSQFLPMNSRC